MASVTLSSVRKSFGSTEVVHGVDVEIEDGEFCVLVGPSGCGKSTLLRMIAALVCWLASEDCSFSTSSVFDISGGRATY